MLAVIAWLAAACGSGGATPDGGPDGTPSCWIHDCPDDPGATTCGTCTHPGADTECTPGFVCSCSAICVKGPRSNDGGVCQPDAGVEPTAPDAGVAADARMYSWPVCEP